MIELINFDKQQCSPEINSYLPETVPTTTFDSDPYPLSIDDNQVNHSHVSPDNPRYETENIQLQAYLYTLMTPGLQNTVHFGTGSEHICV